jgi:hypothetical protein
LSIYGEGGFFVRVALLQLEILLDNTHKGAYLPNLKVIIKFQIINFTALSVEILDNVPTALLEFLPPILVKLII